MQPSTPRRQLRVRCSPGLRSSCRCSRILARSCLSFGKRFSFLYRLIDGRLYNLKKDVSVQDSKHRKTLSEYLMEFNSNLCDLMELSPLFSYDSRVAEAASVAQKLRHLLKKILEDMEYLFHQLWEMQLLAEA
ncbi:uncharacterized protein [Phaseolus vulgaris]|uniref:uncharacterized protein n=1 Tax=Phaseolus vulgaris TaxID=3885 RepID=UPI0035CBB57D